MFLLGEIGGLQRVRDDFPPYTARGGHSSFVQYEDGIDQSVVILLGSMFLGVCIMP